MKLIIAGCRPEKKSFDCSAMGFLDDWTPPTICGRSTDEIYKILCSAIADSGFAPDTIISGTAPGVDKLGERYASNHGLALNKYPADWHKNGKSAGFIRNKEMAAVADGLVAIWDGKSRGTAHMITTMRELGKPVFVKIVGPDSRL